MSKTLNLLASIITILNFIIVLVHSLSLEWPINYNLNLSEYSVSLRITFTVILELCLASFFGFAICYTHKYSKKHEASSLILTVILSLISAWVTFFNLEFVLLGGIELKGFGTFFGLFFLLILTWGIGMKFIAIHLEGDYDDDSWELLATILAISFLLLYIGRIFE